MKANIHPKYVDCTVVCGCGTTFKSRATKERLFVEICSQCHPFYTGKDKFVDAAGMVDKFKKKFDLVKDAVAAKKKKDEDDRKAKLAEHAKKIDDERKKKEEERKKKGVERDAWVQRQTEAAAKKAAEAESAAVSEASKSDGVPAEGEVPKS
ncbi:MAG: 50S ribosomal protein L31 [Planctomycetes bacterium]|nr:50S ribosomal protein L31 [Planctomycetota bacterium]